MCFVIYYAVYTYRICERIREGFPALSLYLAYPTIAFTFTRSGKNKFIYLMICLPNVRKIYPRKEHTENFSVSTPSKCSFSLFGRKFASRVQDFIRFLLSIQQMYEFSWMNGTNLACIHLNYFLLKTGFF